MLFTNVLCHEIFKEQYIYISILFMICYAGGVDYGFFPTSFFPALTLILASETSVDFPIPIINDDIIERTENFNVTYVYMCTTAQQPSNSHTHTHTE